MSGSEPAAVPTVAAVAWDWRGAPARSEARERSRVSRVWLGVALASLVAAFFAWRAHPVASAFAGLFAALQLVFGIFLGTRGRDLLDRGVGAFASAVGAVTAFVTLAPVFYLVLTPLGLWRGLREDPLHRKADPKATTYWAPHGRPPTHRRQF